MNKSQGNGFLDIAVVGAAVMLYTKTAEVLSYFAPDSLSQIIGFDVSALYGNACALFIEGVALYLHFSKRATTAMAHFVKWALIAISGACQIFDGFIVTETLSEQSDTVKFLFMYGVPSIPLLLVVMIFFIGHLPEEGQRAPYKGLKHTWEQLPKIWHGENYTPNAKPKTKTEDKPKENFQAPPR